MKYFLYTGLIIISFCRFQCTPQCNEHKKIDLGNLPQEAKNFVPYIHNDTILFKHSQGEIFAFVTDIKSEKVDNSFSENCNSILSEELHITLTPNYPIFSCNFTVSQFDSIHYNVNLGIKNNNFNIPIETWNIDSIAINNSWYKQVWSFKALTDNYIQRDLIDIDSVYFNKTEGILKITMTNGEFYEIDK